jgi:hypothetical protein
MALFSHTICSTLHKQVKYRTDAEGHNVTIVNMTSIQMTLPPHLNTASREINTGRLLDP